MKNTKILFRIIPLLLTAALLLTFRSFPMDNRVFDDAGLFTASEESQIQDAVENAVEKMNMDVVILTTYEPAEDATVAYADDYYDNNGFGIGSDHSGLIFVIDMNNRFFTITTCGKMIDYLYNARLEAIYDEVYYYASEGDFAGAALTVVEMVTDYYNDGIPDDQYRYEEDPGEVTRDYEYNYNENYRKPTFFERLTPFEIFISLIIALTVALIFYSKTVSSYSLKGSTYTYNTSKNVTCNMTGGTDRYRTTTVTRTRRSPPPSSGGSGGSSHSSHGGRSGSGTHSSSSGRTHGGGGGRHF